MNHKAMALSIIAGLTAQPVWAAGFFKDSTVTLGLRNFYIDQDYRDGSQKPSMAKEWGQGFILDYVSGYTPGPVGFGIDVLGLWGLRLDSGKGTHYNPNSTSFSGIVFPTDHSGRAVPSFGSILPTGKIKFSKTEILAGTLRPTLPVVHINNGRLLTQTFSGAQITSKEIDGLTLLAGRLERAKGRTSSNGEPMSIAGSNNPQTGRFSNKFYYGGFDFALSKKLQLRYYYGNLKDFYAQHFVELLHTFDISENHRLKTDFRYFNSHSSGANSHASGRADGYKSNGYWKATDRHRYEVDNRVISAFLTYLTGGHSLGAGFQRLSGKSDFPTLNNGDGYTTYLMTDYQPGQFSEYNKFLYAGEQTWRVDYSYDFAALGIPGLKAIVIYQSGDHVKAAGHGQSEWERDERISYTVQSGALKNLGVSYWHATYRTNVRTSRSIDEDRVYVTYSLPLL